jgi:hypothetical protein
MSRQYGTQRAPCATAIDIESARLRGGNDYKINLKAELEIRHLHEKLDHLLRRQYNRLFEIQQIQIELLEELGSNAKADPPPGQRSIIVPRISG